jgi:hypothetical protein
MQPSTANSARHAAGSLQTTHRHVVQFYEDEEFLYEAVSGFLVAGLKAGQPAVVFARAESLHAFATRLDRQGYDHRAAIHNGSLVMHDAREVLATFMRGSVVDEDRFMSEVGSIVQKASAGRETVVRAFGEMVDVLFRDGNAQAAIRLEELWNQLAETHSFELLCAYAINNFYTETHAEGLKEICRKHSHVVPAETYALLTDDHERSVKVIELQQRARALYVEVDHRKAIERTLREALADRQAAKQEAELARGTRDDFLAFMSHEMRTPLTVIIGYEELMEQGLGGAVTEQQHAYLKGIKGGATHLLRLIDQILTRSRIEADEDAG